MNLDKLMADPKAAEVFTNISSDTPLNEIVDDHLRARISGDTSTALGLEYHVRQLATTHFHEPDVLAALGRIDRQCHIRKMGRNAPKRMQSVADKIEKAYHAWDYRKTHDGRIRFNVDGKLKITCKDSPVAVAMVVAKYRRGLPSGFGNGKASR
jgi:hypothetical protein